MVTVKAGQLAETVVSCVFKLCQENLKINKPYLCHLLGGTPR